MLQLPPNVSKAGLRALCRVSLLLLLAAGTASCEDDPVAEPSNDNQPAGSYGGRLARPEPHGPAAAATHPGVHGHNPETY